MTLSICHACNKKIKTTLLSCDSCNHWFCDNYHGLDPEVIKMLEKNVSKFVLWFCKTCGPKATDLKNISTKLDMVLDNLSTNNIIPILSKLDNVIEKSSFDNTSTLPSTHICQLILKRGQTQHF